MRPGFLNIREGSYKQAEGKARMNPVMLDWNWKYELELINYNVDR